MSNAKRKNRTRASKAFSKLTKEEKQINLNPLLSVIVNLIPLFLIVLNLRAIVGVEQNHLPPAKYNGSSKLKSKKLVDVDINLYSGKTQVVLRNHEGAIIKKRIFRDIRNEKNKNKIIDFIKSNQKTDMGHLTINPVGKKLNFDSISQAIDISNFKIDEKRVFKNFSIGNIL